MDRKKWLFFFPSSMLHTPGGIHLGAASIWDHRAQVVHLPWDKSMDSADSSSFSIADSLATAFHIAIEPRDGMLLFPSALFWHWALLPKISVRIQKISHFLTVCVGTEKITVKADLDRYITNFITKSEKGFMYSVSWMAPKKPSPLHEIYLKQTNCTYGSSTSLSVSLSGLSLSACPFSFSEGGSSGAGIGRDGGPLSTAGGASAGSCASAATPWHSGDKKTNRYILYQGNINNM